MSTLNLSDIVKAYGITALAKHMVSEEKSFGISEEQLTKLATEHAQRAYPGDRPDVAFSKLFSDSSEDGVTLRRAITIAKATEAAPYFDLKPVFVGDDAALDVDDPSEAIAQLTRIGRQKWPTASEAEAFERAFTDPANATLAAKAYRRPAATSIYPFPK